MKRAAALSAALLLIGCSSDNNSDYQAYYSLLRQSVHGALSDGAVTAQEAAAVSQASMGVRIDDGPESLFVLASDTYGDQLWKSKAHIAIVTREGRIIRTVGLDHDIGGVAPLAGQAIPPPAAALRQAYVSTRSADFPDIGAYAVTIVCSSVPAGAQDVTILGNRIATMRVDEHCRSVARNWDFTDSYWVDPQNGFVWRAQQHAHPSGEVLTTEILHRPR